MKKAKFDEKNHTKRTAAFLHSSIFTPSTIIIMSYPISQYPPCPPFFLISTNIIVVTNFSYHYSFATTALHKTFIQFMTFFSPHSLSFLGKYVQQNQRKMLFLQPKIRVSKNTLLLNTKIASKIVLFMHFAMYFMLYIPPARNNQEKILFVYFVLPKPTKHTTLSLNRNVICLYDIFVVASFL